MKCILQVINCGGGDNQSLFWNAAGPAGTYIPFGLPQIVRGTWFFTGIQLQTPSTHTWRRWNTRFKFFFSQFLQFYFLNFCAIIVLSVSGSGILLFIFHANFLNEITARLCGPCSVHAVVLNDKFQLPIFLVKHWCHKRSLFKCIVFSFCWMSTVSLTLCAAPPAGQPFHILVQSCSGNQQTVHPSGRVAHSKGT